MKHAALKKAVTLLPFAFAIHNAEEALTMKHWMANSPITGQYSVSLQQFIIAVTLFTLLGFIVVFNRVMYKTGKQFLLVSAAFSGMLLLNVFIPHLIGAIIYLSYMPGLFTALTINLPLTVYILYLLQKHLLLNTKEIILSIIAGGFIGIILLIVFLSVGSMVL